MLAELAAANAAFAVIKQCVQNGRELASAGKQISDFVCAKEELTRRKNKKTNRGYKASDLEEFMALEKIKQNEQQLKEIMIWTGRPGLWNDWQKFLAEARKSRRVQEELAKKRREELTQLFGICLGIAIFVIGMIGIVYWALWLKGTL
jgi:preprotein translocase subunit Sss1